MNDKPEHPVSVTAARIGRNPDAQKIHEERQRNLPPEQRKTDPSSPSKVRERDQARDDRDRTRRDYRD